MNGIVFMTGAMRVKFLCFIGMSLLCSAQALAQDEIFFDNRVLRDSIITVLATGQTQRIDTSGQSLAIVGRKEIESVQGQDLTRVLQRLPGVTLSRNGGPGATTSLFVRGADSEQLLVLIDGVRVADVSSPGGGYDFGNLLSGSVEKVEMLRGSNSVVWGSQAIGGVLAVTSRQLEGVEASADYGAYNSVYATTAAGFRAGALTATLTGGYARSDGFSAFSGGTEPDGFRQYQAGTKVALDLGGGLTAVADGRYTKGHLDLDFFGDSSDVQDTREISGRAGLNFDSADFNIAGGFALADIRRDYDGPFGPYNYLGRNERAELNGRWNLSGTIAVVFGGDHERQRYSGSFDARQSASTSSGHVLLDARVGPARLSGGVRLDDHSRFGSEWSLGANASVELSPDWRVRASYGEGFKAPTLYQLYSFAGDLGLVPERSHSYDAAIEMGDRNGPFHAALTAFRRDSRDLIVYRDPFGPYYNVGRARAEGLEVELGAAVSERFTAQAVYSYVKAVNRTPGLADLGNDLARRPRHTVTVSADWRTPLRDLALGADVRMVGDSFDNAANTVRLDGYAVVTLRASIPVSETFGVFGRIENVGNATYETAGGFATSHRAAYVGVRARL